MADDSSTNTNSGKITVQSAEELAKVQGEVDGLLDKDRTAEEEDRLDVLGMAILVYENTTEDWGQSPSEWREDAGEAKQEDRSEGGGGSSSSG